MIIGTGNDLTDIRRIEQTCKRFGERFENRIFTEGEQKKAHARKSDRAHNSVYSTYAKRFAAKEACAKALGVSFRKGISYKDIEVANTDLGKPYLILHGHAQKALEALTPQGYRPVSHLALSDESPYAVAHVILEAIVIIK